MINFYQHANAMKCSLKKVYKILTRTNIFFPLTPLSSSVLLHILFCCFCLRIRIWSFILYYYKEKQNRRLPEFLKPDKSMNNSGQKALSHYLPGLIVLYKSLTMIVTSFLSSKCNRT